MSEQLAAQLALLPGYLTAHLRLTLIALLVGTAVSVPLGTWVVHRARLEHVVVGAASVIQTIPGLALLAIMVPALALASAATAQLAGIELQSIGALPAVIALSLYSMLPILRNTVTGIAGVDPAIVEAARGVGMTPSQLLRSVTLPLALPVVVAGLRTAAVWVVGTATLSTPVGATSLGNYIFSGLQTRNFTAVSVGCVAAAALALFLDQLIRLLEVAVRTRRRPLLAAIAAVLVTLYAYAGASALGRRAAEGPPVIIGAKAFTEQYILSAMLARRIGNRTGVPTRIVSSLGSTVAFDALRSGAIDLYVDYSGTIWFTIMKRTAVPADPAEVLPAVDRFLLDTYGITVVGPLGFENAYALAMRRDHARHLGIRRVSDLEPSASRLSIAADYEFFARPEWPQLKAAYGFAFRERRSMDPALMYQAVAEGEVDVITAFSTDGRIAAFDLVTLEDDRHAIPPYDAIILAGERIALERPAVLASLSALVGSIDATAMRRMNMAVDRDGRTPAAVAAGFLSRAATRIAPR